MGCLKKIKDVLSQVVCGGEAVDELHTDPWCVPRGEGAGPLQPRVEQNSLQSGQVFAKPPPSVGSYLLKREKERENDR